MSLPAGWVVLGVVVAVVLEVGACGGDGAPVTARDGRAGSSEQGWSAIGVVIAPEGRPAMFCAFVLDSLPPQCGAGVPVQGVDLETLPGGQRAGGVTFSDPVRLVGRWDGEVLVVTEPPSAAPRAPAHTRQQLRQAATAAAEALSSAGYTVLSSGIDEIANRAHVELLVASDDAQAVLDDHALSSTVRLGAWLQPVAPLDDPEPTGSPGRDRHEPSA